MKILSFILKVESNEDIPFDIEINTIKADTSSGNVWCMSKYKNL